MSLIVGGASPSIEAARRAVPEEYWEYISKTSIAAVHGNRVAKFENTLEGFLFFLEYIGNSSIASEISIFALPKRTYAEYYVKVYSLSCKVETWSFGIPIKYRKTTPEVCLIPDSSVSHILYTEDGVLTSSMRLATEAQIKNETLRNGWKFSEDSSNYSIQIPKLAKLALTFDYQL